MPEKPIQKKLVEKETFVGFWMSCAWIAAKKAWGQLDHFNNVSSVLQWVAALGWMAAWIAKRKLEAGVIYWLLAIPVGVSISIFIFHLFKAPYQKYEDLFEASESEKKEQEKQMNKMTMDFEDSKNNLQKRIENLELRLKPKLSVRVIKISDLSRGSLNYYCRVEVTNDSETSIDNIGVKLRNIDPLPTRELVTVFEKPIPNTFPIDLVGLQSGPLNPRCSAFFALFKMVRHGSVPQLEISESFNAFSVESKWITEQATLKVTFPVYTFDLEASARNCHALLIRIQVEFVNDATGICSFEIRSEQTI